MFKTKELAWGLLLLLSLVTVLGGCAQPQPVSADPEPAPMEETEEQLFQVGILQFSEHPVLDEARAGTIDALADQGFAEGKNVTYNYKNAQGQPTTATIISQDFAADNVDLIIAITIQAVESAAKVTKDIPIVFNSATNPQANGVIESWERPNTNVTGVSDLNPVRETLELIRMIQPESKVIGVIYNMGEVNSVLQVNIARNLAPELGFEIVESTVTHTGEVGTATEALIGKVDAVYLPTDNSVTTECHAILRVTEKNNLLLVGSNIEYAAQGAVAAIGFDYHELGYQSGIMAAQVLQGANPAEMPIQLPNRVFYAINETAAANIGIELPQNLVNRAELKY